MSTVIISKPPCTIFKLESFKRTDVKRRNEAIYGITHVNAAGPNLDKSDNNFKIYININAKIKR